MSGAAPSGRRQFSRWKNGRTSQSRNGVSRYGVYRFGFVLDGFDFRIREMCAGRISFDSTSENIRHSITTTDIASKNGPE